MSKSNSDTMTKTIENLGLAIFGLGIVGGFVIFLNKSYRPKPSDKEKNELKVVAWQVGDDFVYTDALNGKKKYQIKPNQTQNNVSAGDTLILGFNKKGEATAKPVAKVYNYGCRKVYYIKNNTKQK